MLSAAMPAAQTLPTSNFWAEHTSFILFLCCWAKSKSGTLRHSLCRDVSVLLGQCRPWPQQPAQGSSLCRINPSNQWNSTAGHSLQGLHRPLGRNCHLPSTLGLLLSYSGHSWSGIPGMGTWVCESVCRRKYWKGGAGKCQYLCVENPYCNSDKILFTGLRKTWLALELASHLILYSDMKCHRELPTQPQAILCRNTTCTFPVLNFLLHNCPKLWLNTKQASFAVLWLRNKFPISKVLLAAGITTFAGDGHTKNSRTLCRVTTVLLLCSQRDTGEELQETQLSVEGEVWQRWGSIEVHLKMKKCFQVEVSALRYPRGFSLGAATQAAQRSQGCSAGSLRESPRPSRLHKISPEPQFPRGSQTCYYFPVEVASLSIILKEKTKNHY